MRRIVYLQYTNPAAYPPLEHSGLLLLNAGWDVRFFGVRGEGESDKLTFSEPLACRQTLWRRAPRGWRQKLHFVRFTFAAVRYARRLRAHWVYCSDLMTCPAAWSIRRLTRCRVLYHEHDSPSMEHGAGSEERGGRSTEQGAGSAEWGVGRDEKRPGARPSTSRFQRLLLSFRKRLGREADLVVFPNQRRLDYFQAVTGRQKPSFCVYNCPRLDEVRPPRLPQAVSGRLRLAFHGSINRDRLPMALLPALAQFKGAVELQIVGYNTVGSSDYLADFLAEAKRLGIDRDVDFRGALPRHDIFAPAATCGVGLVLMPMNGGDVNMANMTGASNKAFDYLACGLALLVTSGPAWEEMFVHPGYGLACNPVDADSIAKNLRWFLEHPGDTRSMGERGRQRILREWNYENQFSTVIDRL